MNKKDEKWTVEAANYFKAEVLDIMPDIPSEELSAMVGEYIYYQQADASKDETKKIALATCIAK